MVAVLGAGPASRACPVLARTVIRPARRPRRGDRGDISPRLGDRVGVIAVTGAFVWLWFSWSLFPV